jgi:hypothetical protein
MPQKKRRQNLRSPSNSIRSRIDNRRIGWWMHKASCPGSRH